MKRKSKRLLALLLSTAILVGVTVCQGKGEGQEAVADSSKDVVDSTGILNEPGTYPIVKEPIELKIFCLSAPNVENLETNDFTKYMEEKTGIKLIFETGTRDDYTTKLNLATTEEFYDVCKKFLEMNPTGIAVGGANKGWHAMFEEFIMNSFAFSPGKVQSYRDETAVNKEGKVVTVANSESYREDLEKLLYDATKDKIEPYAQKGEFDILLSLKLTDEEATSIQTIGVEVQNYIEENKVAFITGTKYFVNSIPDELYEAGQIDGCTPFKYLMKVVVPLSKPILAVLVLYYGVAKWNSYFDAMIYLKNRHLCHCRLY